MGGGIAAAESYRINIAFRELDGEKLKAETALKPGYVPGDLAFDPLGLAPTDPAEFREMQEKELSHGRLGMLAAAGFMAQEAVSGKTWGQQDVNFENFLLGPLFKAENVELARDAMTFTN